MGFITLTLLQGIFFNAYFLAYILSPKSCHAFVGYLEEEAVKTYSHAIADLDKGRLPEWSNKKVKYCICVCVCLSVCLSQNARPLYCMTFTQAAFLSGHVVVASVKLQPTPCNPFCIAEMPGVNTGKPSD